MDIVGMIINLVSGAVGGNIAGAVLKDKTLGAIGNTIAGAVGGVAGAYIMQAVGVLDAVGMANMTIGSVLGYVGSSAGGGAILTVIAGMIKNAMSKG